MQHSFGPADIANKLNCTPEIDQNQYPWQILVFFLQINRCIHVESVQKIGINYIGTADRHLAFQSSPTEWFQTLDYYMYLKLCFLFYFLNFPHLVNRYYCENPFEFFKILSMFYVWKVVGHIQYMVYGE